MWLSKHERGLLQALRAFVMVLIGLCLLAVLYWNRTSIGPISLWLGVGAVGVGCIILAGIRPNDPKKALHHRHAKG